MKLIRADRFFRLRIMLYRALCSALVIVSWSGTAAGHAAAGNPAVAKEVKIGVLANRGSDECLAKWSATAEYLTEHVPGFRFRIIPLGYADVESAVAKQRVDFILVNPAMYVTFEDQYQIGRIATLKSRQGDSVASTYGTVIFCRADSKSIRSLRDLKGKSFMAPDENSFGGWLMALRELLKRGIDPNYDFKSLQYSGTQDAVVLAVLQGDVDAGAICTNTLERMAEEGKVRLDDFYVLIAYDGTRDAEFPYLISTRTYPEWALAKLQHTPLALAEKITEQLRKMPPDAQAAKKAGIAGWTYPYDYNDVRECLKELSVGPFRPSMNVTLAAVVRAYWLWLLAGMLTIAAMAGAIAVFARLNRRLAFAEKGTRDELSQRRGAEQRLAAAAEELRLAKERAEDAATRLRTLSRAVEQNPASVVITDLEGTVEYVNPGFVSTTGYALEEVIGKNPRVLKSNMHPPKFYMEMWQTLLRKEVWRGEICNRKKNGELYWEDATIAPVVDADGHTTHFVAVKMDITERTRADMELQEALTQLQWTTAFQKAILNSTEYAIIATEPDGTITVFNAGAEHLLGYRAEEVVGKVTPEIIHDKSEVIKRAKILSQELGYPIAPTFVAFVAKARPGQPDENEWTYIRKNGTRFPVLLSVTSICNDTGQITGYMGIAQDITERKQAEDTLQLAKKQAEEANRAKSQFLAMMSHELRTPLSGVIGMTELLRNTQLDERQREFVDACHSSGKSLLNLINDILDFSKIEAGKLELDEHEFDLELVVEEIVETMTFHSRQKGLKLSCCITPQACCRVRGDSERLRQVLVNLIGNAIKFTEAGKVDVKIESAETQTGKAAFRFEVSDTGIGIPSDRIDRLFESFSQADSSTTRKYGGTGLGLAICKRLVKLMGGRIGVESEVGQGSTFWFEVSIQPVQSEQQQNEDWSELADVRQKTRNTLLQKRRILLAEDNRVNRMYAREILQQAGIECRAVENGLQAIQTLESDHFDLILMDSQMPEMDGYEATRRIREMEHSGQLAGHLPVIALSANAIKGDREQCLAAGMDAYISKPFEPDRLLDVIAQLLGTKEGKPAEEPALQPQQTPSPPDGPPLIDRDAFLVRCMGNLEFALSLLSDFESELPEYVDQIARHVREGDAKATAESAHSLKGAAGTVTAEPLRLLAAKIESAGIAGDLAEVASLVDQLRDEAQRSMRAIPKLREQMTRS